MKLFEIENTSDPIPYRAEQECAAQMMDTVPLIMRTLRQEIRSRRPSDLSVPQFRVLAFLSRNEGAALSDVANHIGLMRPTMSKMIETLVRRNLVFRETSSADRRYLRLRLTKTGALLIQAAREETRSRLANLLHDLPRKDVEQIGQSMMVLQRVFAPSTDAERKVSK